MPRESGLHRHHNGTSHEPGQRSAASISSQGVEIGEFAVKPRPTYIRVTSRHAVATAGAIASVLLHLALLTPVFWGGAQPSHPPIPPPGLGISKPNATDEIAFELVTVTEPEAAATRAPVPAVQTPLLTPVRVTMDLSQLSVDFPAPTPGENDSNTLLQGQYMGQISARIDRAWIRPRAPIGDERFMCQVRIEQDSAGNVKEVALERCNGTPRWQLSLVHAIETASPLPAPPDISVFAHAVHMRFEAVPVDLAVSREQYEPGSQ